MRILFTAPPYVGLAGERGGVLKAMRHRADSLTVLGHKVVFLDVWQETAWRTFDVCHLFMANGDSYTLGMEIARRLPLVVSPIIDRVAPDWVLRANVALNDYVPAVYTHLGRCAELCRAADLIVVHSLYEKKRVEQGLNVRGKTLVVLSPVPVLRAEPAVKADRGTKTMFFLGDMGNLRKNVHRLVSAAKGLPARLVLAGSWPVGRKLAKLKQACAEAGNVDLMGPVSEERKMELMSACDVFVLPSLVESIGLAAVEAGLLGKTVVATSRGGTRDYLQDDVYYVDPSDVKDIRRVLRRALEAPKNPAPGLRARLDMEQLGAALAAGYERITSARAGVLV